MELMNNSNTGKVTPQPGSTRMRYHYWTTGIAAWLIFLSALLPATSAAQTVSDSQTINESVEQNPYLLTKLLSEQLLHELKNLSETDDRKQALQGLVTQQLLPWMDSRYITKYALGSHLRKFDKQQFLAFEQAFQQHLVQTWANALTRFDNQQVTVFLPAQLKDDAKKIAIKAQITGAGDPPVDIQFKLRKNKNTGQWRVYDFVAEGISLLTAKRSEVAQLIRQKGINGAVASLKAAS